MKNYPISKIRNVCLLSHSKAGKTSLAEAMLFNAGAIDRQGKVSDGTTVCDFDPEEIKRVMSVSTAVVPFEYKGVKINVLDTPGYFDFIGEMQEGARVSDAAVILVSGRSGVNVGTKNAWDLAEKHSLARIIFVSKMDDERSDYTKVLQQLKEAFGKKIAPFNVPIINGDKFDGFVNVVDMVARKFDASTGKIVDFPIPDGMESELDPVRDMIMEAVAETDEKLMERYFDGETFSADEIHRALRVGVETGDIVPVMCGSSITGHGVPTLLNSIIEYFPSPDEIENIKAKNAKNGAEGTILPKEDEPFSAFIFKTVADPYVGKISMFRVYSGSVKSDSLIYNSTTGETEKIGALCHIFGKKQIPTDCLTAGDIGAVTKLASANTGDTLSAPDRPLEFEKIDFPAPNMHMAILPTSKGDEEKISSGLHKLMEEDLTFKVENNTETKQQLIWGLGDQHIDLIVNKLKSKFGVSVVLKEPKVAYREAIKTKVKVEGKHKKQSGGHGQYGHVWIEFEPTDSAELVFEEKIFGGSVPKNYFPAVEKGLRDSVANGVLAGYPVVNLKATLVDGSYHPVDSSEMAFKTAASIAYKEGLKKANPVILEPIGTLTVCAPDDVMGDVMGDINKRRGRVLGMTPQSGGMTEVIAEVPMSEMHSYATDIRSMTQGAGGFSVEFSRYEEAPHNVAEQIIADAQKED